MAKTIKMNKNLKKVIIPALFGVLAVVLAIAIAATIPSADVVPESAGEKIEYAYYAPNMTIDRLEVVATNNGDEPREYIVVMYDEEVTVMVEITAKQYMLMREDAIVGGHLVVMKDGSAAFTFEGEETPNEVISHARNT
jgi:hypothetical protein